MHVITPALLVAAVTEITKGRTSLVRARDVLAWCDRNLVDCQGEGALHQALWEADLEEARGQRRLLRFKSGECKQSRVGWALIAQGAKAREAAARLGWHEMVWNGERWEWLQAPTPSTPPAVAVDPVRVEPVRVEPAWG